MTRLLIGGGVTAFVAFISALGAQAALRAESVAAMSLSANQCEHRSSLTDLPAGGATTLHFSFLPSKTGVNGRYCHPGWQTTARSK